MSFPCVLQFLQDTLDTLFGILDESSQRYGLKVFDSLVSEFLFPLFFFSFRLLRNRMSLIVPVESSQLRLPSRSLPIDILLNNKIQFLCLSHIKNNKKYLKRTFVFYFYEVAFSVATAQFSILGSIKCICCLYSVLVCLSCLV